VRLAVLGHTYVLAENQAKYAAMRRLDPQLELRLIVPKRLRNSAFRFSHSAERHPELASEEVVACGTAFPRSHMATLYDPARVARCFSCFRPEVIHVEEEPQALLTMETVLLRAAFAPRAAFTLFTWDNLLRRRRFPLGAAKRHLRRLALRRCDALVCGNAEAESRVCGEGFLGLTSVIPQLGLDSADHFQGSEPELRSELGLSDGIVVGYAGRFVAEKGLRPLYEALALLARRPWKLLLVGGGPLDREITEEWIPRFPGRIICVPPVSRRDVPHYLRAMDVFVLNSYAVPGWKEQFGYTLAQAMMLGLACVVSNSGAIPEVAGAGAVVVAERNTAELSAALGVLLVSPDIRRALGARARERALAHFTNAGIAARHRLVFERALENRGETSNIGELLALPPDRKIFDTESRHDNRS
jgi:L-malate glycosyltransferase